LCCPNEETLKARQGGFSVAISYIAKRNFIWYNITNYEKAHEVNYKFLLPIMTFAILSLLLGVFGNSFIELVIKLLGGII